MVERVCQTVTFGLEYFRWSHSSAGSFTVTRLSRSPNCDSYMRFRLKSAPPALLGEILDLYKTHIAIHKTKASSLNYLLKGIWYFGQQKRRSVSCCIRVTSSKRGTSTVLLKIQIILWTPCTFCHVAVSPVLYVMKDEVLIHLVEDDKHVLIYCFEF